MSTAIVPDRKTRVELLKRHGYKFNIEKIAYVNRDSRKVFSYEFVDDHDESEIENCILSPPPESGWTFYFDQPVTASLRKILEEFYTNGRRIER